MRNIIIILAFLCFFGAQAQISVTKDGYARVKKKPQETTMSNNDTLNISKVDGIIRGIALVDFKDLIFGSYSAFDIPITDSGNNYTEGNIEGALIEIAQRTFIDGSSFNGLLSPTIDTAQELAGVVDNIDGTDDQTATEVPFTPYGDNPHTTVQAAMNWLIDRDGSGVSWDTDPVGGSNFLVSNIASTIAKTSISTGPNGDYLDGARGLGLNPNDTPDKTVKGWMYMDNSESKVKVHNGASFKNLAYEDQVIRSGLTNQVATTTTIEGVNGEGISVNPGSGVTTVRGGDGSQYSRLIYRAAGITMDGVSEAEMLALGGSAILNANAIDNKIAAASYPTTAQRFYVVENLVKDTLSTADFTNAANHKSLVIRNVDTLLVNGSVSFVNFPNTPFLVQPTTKDSTYIKKGDGIDFFVAGQTAAISGDGLIIKNRNYATGEKIGPNSYQWSGKLTVHTEFVDAIMATTPEFFYSPSSIDADAVSDGDAITGANAWTDASGNGHDLTIGSGTFELNVQAGVGRQVRWTSPGYFDVPDAASLDVVPGTDEFTMIFRVGEGLNPDGSGYAISKAPATSNLRTGIYFDAPGSFADVLVGGTGIAVSPDSFTANALVIATVSTTVLNMWVDGVQVVTDAPIGTNDPTGQSWNIGGRSDGGYLAGIGYTTDLVAMTKKAISTAERLAIEAQYQINP